MGRRPGGMGCPGSVVTDLRLTASQPPLLPPPSLTTASSNRITSQLGTVHSTTRPVNIPTTTLISPQSDITTLTQKFRICIFSDFVMLNRIWDNNVLSLLNI